MFSRILKLMDNLCFLSKCFVLISGNMKFNYSTEFKCLIQVYRKNWTFVATHRDGVEYDKQLNICRCTNRDQVYGVGCATCHQHKIATKCYS